jgi:hypothetical protein
MEVVRDERGELSDEGYARERYGWWGNPKLGRGGVINMTTWVGLKVEAQAPTKGLVVVDVAPDLGWTSVAVASRHGSKTLVLVDRFEGTDGAAVAKVLGLSEDLEDLVEVALTPTAHLLSADLTKAKVEHKQLTGADLGRAPPPRKLAKRASTNDLATIGF